MPINDSSIHQVLVGFKPFQDEELKFFQWCQLILNSIHSRYVVAEVFNVKIHGINVHTHSRIIINYCVLLVALLHNHYHEIYEGMMTALSVIKIHMEITYAWLIARLCCAHNKNI